MDDHGRTWMTMDENRRTWNMDGHGRTWMVMDEHGWTWTNMDGTWAMNMDGHGHGHGWTWTNMGEHG